MDIKYLILIANVIFCLVSSLALSAYVRNHDANKRPACLISCIYFAFFAAAVIYWVPGHLIIFAEIGSFLLSIALLIVLQQKVVDLTRKLNPEKQGSVYDLKFRKKWLNSCDEAERKQIGQAAYKAYSVLNATCPILWAVLLLLGFVLEISLLPSFLVLLVWGILNLTYIAECIRMNRHSLPNM